MFWALTVLAFLLSIAGGIVFVAQVSPPDFMAPLADAVDNLEYSVLIGIGALALPFALILLAYIASLVRQRRKRRRPVVALYLLSFSLFWLVAASIVTTFDPDDFFTPIPLAATGAAIVLLAFVPRLVEIAIGRTAVATGDGLLKQERWRMASSSLGLARLFLPGDERLERNQGIALYELGETEAALALLTQAYRRGERDPRVIRALADSVFELPGELAADVLLDALRLDPNNVKLGRKIVELHLRAKRPEDALPVLERFYDPANIEDVCLLARLHAEQGNVDRALALTRNATELEGPPFKRSLANLQILAMQAPRHLGVLLALAEFTEKAGNRDEAASWYQALLDVEEENIDARRNLIRLYRQLGRLDQTLVHYRTLLLQDPESPATAIEYGQLLEDRQEWERALKVFQDFAERHPEDYRFDYHAAVCLFNLDQLDEAAAALDQAREKAPAGERARVQMLASRIQNARVERELGVLREQASQNDGSIDARLQYVERLIRYQQGENAAREIDLLLHQFPDQRAGIVRFLEEIVDRGEPQFILLNLLADIYLQEREFDRSHALYERMAQMSLHPDEVLIDGCRKILRLQPNHLPSLKTQSTLMIKTGHYREAARVMAKILDLSPPARESLLPMLFEVYYQLGDAERALPYGEELLQGDSHNLNLYLRMRELMVKREDHMGAMRIVKSALEIAPGNRQLREMLEESERRLKESRVEYLTRQLESTPDDPLLWHELADLSLGFERYKEAISAYHRASENAEGNLRNLSLVKLARCLAVRQMFDLSDETIREMDLHRKDTEYLDEIKGYIYEVGKLFELDEQYERALQIYKRLFKLDAGYKDIVDKIEVLSHLQR